MQHKHERTYSAHPNLLNGGEMRARIAAFDWSRTALGAASTWPQSLKSAVEIMLTSRYPMLVWWGHDLIQFYNDAYVPVLGQRHPWGLGQPAAACWAEAWPFVGALAEAVMTQGVSTWSERLEMVMTRNGFPEEVYMTFSYSPIVDEHRAIGGLFCACTEDTQRVLGDRRLAALGALANRSASAKTIEQACAATAAVLADIPRDLPFTLLYLLDEDQRTARLVGYTGFERETLANPPHVNLGATNEAWPFSKVLTQGTIAHVSITEAPDGTFSSPWPEPPREAVVLPLPRSGRAGLAGFLVAGLSPRLVFDESYRTFLDLLARHVATALAAARAYEEERARAEALAEIDRAKTVFFSNISHEFRTPLSLMLGPLEELLTGTNDLDEATAERIELASRNARRLLKLVNTLLDFSRIEAGRAEASYEPIDLAEFTAELASNFRSATERAGLSLVVEADPLPEPVYVDRDMWEKIVLNLISNAFKFTHEGEIVVAVRPTADGHAAELEVRDTGIGIAAHELPRLFERFHRVEGARGRSFEGTGIGLALVQELVRLHGGTITVTSEVDRGSRFIVRLPFGTGHLPQGRVESAKARTSTVIRAGTFVEEALGWLPPAADGDQVETRPEHGDRAVGGRVLLADDNADMRAYVQRLLSQHGFSVDAVADGDAALAAARRRPPDLILSDVMMPRTDGLQLLAHVRSDPELKDTPVVLLSARAGEEARAEGVEAGADDYLIKPFAPRELIARVSANLNLARERREALLRERQERQAFLLALGDGLRAQPTANAMIEVAGRLLGERLNASRIVFAEFDETSDVAEIFYGWFADGSKPFSAVMRLENYEGPIVKSLRAGQPVRIEDAGDPSLERSDLAAIAKLGARGLLSVPLLVGDKLKVSLSVHQDAARRWTDDEVALVHEVAQRLWAEVVRSRAEAALRESEERYRTLFESIDQGFCIVQVLFDDEQRAVDYRFLEINPAFERQTGLRDAKGRRMRELAPKLEEHWFEIYGRVAVTGEPIRFENRAEALQGRWFDVYAFRVGEPNERRVAILFNDVTQRKRFDDALRESEARLRAAFSISTVAVLFWGPGFRLIDVNDAFLRMSGFSREEALGKTWQEFTPPEFHAISYRCLNEIAADGECGTFEKQYLRKDGSRWWGLFAPRRIGDEIVEFVLDVTPQHEAQEALRKNEEREALLLRMSAILETAVDPVEAQGIAMRLLGDALGVDQAFYYRAEQTDEGWFHIVEKDYFRKEGMPVRIGRRAHSDFGEALFAPLVRGEPVVIADVEKISGLTPRQRENFRAANLRAFLVVPLIKQGRYVAGVSAQTSTPREWTSNEIAVVHDVAENTWAAAERARAEAALRQSEEKFRSLFEAMDEAFALCELVRDANGRGVDYRYVELNPALVRHAGIYPDALQGRLATEAFPNLDPWLIDTYTRVVDEGQSLLVEHYFPHVDRWLRINAFPRGGDRFAVLYSDVTDRHRAQISLRESEERQTFLLKLSDALRPLSDPEDIRFTAATVLGQHLGANRVAYAENLDDKLYEVGRHYVDGVDEFLGRARYSGFGSDIVSELQAGRSRVQPDMTQDSRLSAAEKEALASAGIVASLNVPLVKDGRLVAWLGVNYKSPHHFSAHEIALVAEVAERTWAAVERARAERTLADELRTMTRLHALADRLLAISDLPTGLGEVLDAALDVFGGDRGTIQILDSEADCLRYAASRGFDEDALRALPPIDRDFHSTCAAAIRTGERIVASDISSDPQWANHASTAAALGYKAAVSSPMKTREEELLGVLTLHFAESYAPNDRELRWIDLFARMAAHLADRARAEAALRESEEALAADLANAELLRGLAERLVTEENIRTVYDEILSTAIVVARSDAGTIQIYDPDTNSLELLASKNFSRTINEYFGRVDASSRTACGIAMNTGQRTFVDFPNELADTGCRLLVDEGLQSALALPLLSRSGKPLGMLNTHWRETKHRPTEKELRFLDLIARQAADLIEQRQAQSVLRQSEERLRQFGEASQDVLWIRDAKTLQWQYLTPAFQTIYGLSRDEALSGNNYRNWLELVLPEDRASATEKIRRVRSGEHVAFEYRIRRPNDGEIRWVRDTDFPITNAAGEVMLIGGIGEDITDAKLNQERVEQSEEWLRSAVEVGKLGLWNWNIQTGEIHWSDEHYRMEGYAVGEVTPSYETWVARIHPEDRAPAEAALRQAMQEHKEYVREFRTMHPDGSVHWLSARGRFFYNDDGQAIRMVGAMVDITERREWEERQKVLNAELQHRTRNLMGMVRSMSEKTARASVDLADFRARFRDRLDALSRVQGLLSRLSEHDRVTFDDLIRTELMALDGSADRVTLSGPQGVRIRSSTVQTLAMALHELTTNAIKYGALGQPSGRLAITWSLESSGAGGKPWLHIAWRESGVEMPAPGSAPQGSGQGRELIEQALPYQLSAKTSYTLGPDGVHCRISIPVSTSTAPVDP